MNEFALIDCFFKNAALARPDVILGIGDDAACVQVPADKQLLISTDTLLPEVHFCSHWDPYDIACKAVMVNISDMAAMAAQPAWISLALTLPNDDKYWLTRFSQGLHDSLRRFNISLIGGDTTRGPLSITLTIHGLASPGQILRRQGAQVGDKIMVSGELGAAALAVFYLDQEILEVRDRGILMAKLQHPEPRVDLANVLQTYATAAIDISDGLSADLNHICTASGVGACIDSNALPIHPLVKQYCLTNAVDFVLQGGDDYELCFTIPAEHEEAFKQALDSLRLECYAIGIIEKEPGLRLINEAGQVNQFIPKGYQHF